MPESGLIHFLFTMNPIFVSKKALISGLISILCLSAGGVLLYFNAPTVHKESSAASVSSPAIATDTVITIAEVSSDSPQASSTPSVYTPVPTPPPSPKAMAGTAALTFTPPRPSEASSEGGTPRPTPKPTPIPTPTPTPTPTQKPKKASALITLSFDDGFKSAYKSAFPLIRDAGIPATWYIITDVWSGQYGTRYMTSDQVLELSRNGQEIGAHTQTHPHLPTLGEDRIRNEIEGSKSDLENLGISVSTFCYPFGEYNSTILSITKDAGFIGARSTHSGFVNIGNDPFTLKSESVEVTITPEQVQTWIDLAEQNGNWLILTFHDVNTAGDQYSVTPNDFKKMLQEILDAKDNGAQIVTVKQGIEIMRGR